MLLVDRSPEVIKHAIKRGHHALLGSAANEAAWEKIGLLKAKLVILTIPDFEEAMMVLKAVKAQAPNTKVIARAEYFRQALSFYEHGADYVVLPAMTATQVFAARVQSFLNGKVNQDGKTREELLRELRTCAADEPVEKLEWFHV